jgi:putative transposase
LCYDTTIFISRYYDTTAMQVQDLREVRGREISEKKTMIRRVNAFKYEVKSQSGSGLYEVVANELGWLCSCPDFKYRAAKCKHIFAVEFSFRMRVAVSTEALAPIEETDCCIFCGANHIRRDGLRHNKAGDLQRFECLECLKTFTINLGFERMKHSPRGITMAMQLYFSGESLRNTQRSLELLGVKVSHQTVYKWITKYVSLMAKYLDKITPQVSDTWRADELFVKFSGKMNYVFAMMDDETRFWIAQLVAEHKGTSDVRPMFREAARRAGKKPDTLISDGAANFHRAFKKEYRTVWAESPNHIRDIRVDGSVHNNKMERMNGEVRDREKVMRGLKNIDSPILKGVQVYHNFIKPHMGLGGRTPAEAAGIQVKGDNKWLTIIQNASSPPKVYRSKEGVNPPLS